MQKKSLAKNITHFSLGLFILGVIVFAGYNLFPFIHGPIISTKTIYDGKNTDQSIITLSGTAQYARDVLINGTPISFGINGDFSHDLILSPGYNHIIISGISRYGKQRDRDYRIVLKENDIPISLSQNNPVQHIENILSSF